MEIADQGDLYGHLFKMQQKYFSEVRIVADLDKKDSTNFAKDFYMNSDDYDLETLKFVETLGYFLNKMILVFLCSCS